MPGFSRITPQGLFDYNTGARGTFSQFRYLVPSSGFGNLGRNSYRNCSTQDYTLAIERVIPIPRFEGHQIELRGEAVNPWNHLNPGLVSTLIDDPEFMNQSLAFTGGRSLYLWVKYRY